MVVPGGPTSNFFLNSSPLAYSEERPEIRSKYFIVLSGRRKNAKITFLCILFKEFSNENDKNNLQGVYLSQAILFYNFHQNFNLKKKKKKKKVGETEVS